LAIKLRWVIMLKIKQISLDEELTVLQTIENAVTEHTKANVRTVLGSFLFSNDDVTKKG
jgi:ATPase subunit of ABC transporter with duplicated ATPase domains